ncbi:MAG: hypothetical protein ACOYJI_01395 [Anaerovoracaceae bacterium]
MATLLLTNINEKTFADMGGLKNVTSVPKPMYIYYTTAITSLPYNGCKKI